LALQEEEAAKSEDKSIWNCTWHYMHVKQ